MSTILIVDDMEIFREPIASTLRSKGYATVCASNGKEAIHVLETQTPDLVLLDLAMPIMDGLTCLKAIRGDARLRDLPVILLTASSDRAHVTQAAQLGVSGYLLKSQFSLKEMLSRVEQHIGPSDAKTIAPATASPAISPSGSTGRSPIPSERVTKEIVWERIGQELHLEAVPPVLHHVLAMINSRETSMDDIAEAMRMDQVLTLRVMQVANSSFYNNGKPVKNLSEVAQRIGLSGLRVVVMTATAMSHFSDVARGGLIPQRFWEHSLATAMLSQLLAQPMAKEETERYFLAGLLHDIGRLGLCRLFPELYQSALQAAAERRADLSTVELECFGVTHAEVTHGLLSQWKLPGDLVEAASLHHSSVAHIKSNAREPRAALVVALANALAHAMACGDSGGMSLVPFHQYAHTLGLDRESVERIALQGMKDAENTELLCASRCAGGIRSPLYRELAQGAKVAPRLAVLANPKHGDPLKLFLRQLGWWEQDCPRAALVYVAEPGEMTQRFSELRDIEARIGNSLPTLVASPEGRMALPSDLAVGRSSAIVAVPGRYSDLVDAIAKLCS
ncbi:MAG TPA: HDOD domain-containing protein [Phycisphaerae bacterium]|nr:HDOD domain-containing protein [Phycisphaerae bacterium]